MVDASETPPGQTAMTRRPRALKPKTAGRSRLTAHWRDTILGAIAQGAQELLRSGNAQQSTPRVLALIGRALSVERAHLLIVNSGPMESRMVVAHDLWTEPGVETPAFFRDGTGVPLGEIGLADWVPRLARGETVAGHASDFSPSARRFLERGGIKSTVVAPVFVDGVWWAMLAFDACRRARQWLPAEIDVIQILAELIGASVVRSRRLQTLADANRIIESSPTVLYRIAPTPPFPLTYVSRNIRQYGYEAEELLAEPLRWTGLIEPHDLGAAIERIQLLANGRSDRERLDFRLLRPDGSWVWFEGDSLAPRDAAGRIVAIEGILSDVTERRRAVETAARLAHTDSLTGLPNRAAFLERLQLALGRAHRTGDGFAVHYLDLDHFKDVNDTLGHSAGDQLLQAVAARLKHCIRDTDAVARFGGDEFAVLQEEASDPATVEAMAAKIGTALSVPFLLGGNQIHSSVSIGIVPYQPDLGGPEAMLMKADLALYRAKDEGRSRFRFHVAALDRQAQERMTIGHELRGAVERNEFELYYQPQVDLATNRIGGLEALLRWNHPARGFVLPSAFIPIAELNGTIVSLGRWVIAEACRQMRIWRDAGLLPPTVAINVSGSQFHLDNGLVGAIGGALRENGLTPEMLEVELTESVLMSSKQKHPATFDRLRQSGVRLAIDDFGTGFSSLDYLRTFHVARLKLAQQFIDEVIDNPDSAAIVRAAISLAKELGIDVIAEGVNNAEQRAFLLAAGCRCGQGDGLGRPLPAAQITDLLAKGISRPQTGSEVVRPSLAVNRGIRAAAG